MGFTLFLLADATCVASRLAMALVRLGEGVLIFMDYKLNSIFFNIIKSLL